MPTQNVNLTPKLDRFVKTAVDSGAFNNASEVHRAALSALAREWEERELRLTRLRQEIQAGLDSGLSARIPVIDDFIETSADRVLTEARSKRKR